MAQQGRHQLVLISGEAGIGKTTLVDAFVAQVTATHMVGVGYGQCTEQYGAGEAYLPVLEAFGRLGRGLDAVRVVGVLRQYTPRWLAHLPALISASEVAGLQRRSGSTVRGSACCGSSPRWWTSSPRPGL
jgi:predicted ATPase